MPRKFLLSVLALGLVVVACDSGGAQPDDAEAEAVGGGCPSGTFPVTVEAANGPVTLEECPDRIVSLSPTATEVLFALGAGEQVVAVDDQSDFPEGVPITDLSGYEPNVEAIAGYDPDLVVVHTTTDDLDGGLAALGIAVLVQPAAGELEDMYRQIEQLGAATGHGRNALDLAKSIRADLNELAASAPRRDEPLTYYHELDDTYFSTTSSTFLGSVYALAGLENIADAADREGSGYPQLSAEYIVEADPDVIFLADAECCGITAETVGARPGWAAITAVRTGAIFPLDEDVASRWGPRVVEFFRTVIEAVESVDAGRGAGEAEAA